MNVLWIFFILVFFCIFVLLGLHITEGIKSTVQLLLAWVIYIIMWSTFLNVFLLGYFWSVIQYKKGPTGQRGPSGEKGNLGIQGTCSIGATEAFLIKALTDYIDALYYSKTNTHIMNDNYKFTNNFLNNKISQTAGSRQYKVLVANLSKDNKPVINLINYLKSIWKQWFELIYDATGTPGSWFIDEFGNDTNEYGWVGANPFIEIRKYDVYYWGITRNFRPLKAEICRSTSNHGDDKFPQPPKLPTRKNKPSEPRLKVIKSNDYYPLREGGSTASGGSQYGLVLGESCNDTDTPYGNFWSAYSQTIGKDTYYPIGDIVTPSVQGDKKGGTFVGDVVQPVRTKKVGDKTEKVDNGPDMKTILVSGDVVDPIGHVHFRDSHSGCNHPRNMAISNAVCP